MIIDYGRQAPFLQRRAVWRNAILIALGLALLSLAPYAIHRIAAYVQKLPFRWDATQRRLTAYNVLLNISLVDSQPMFDEAVDRFDIPDANTGGMPAVRITAHAIPSMDFWLWAMRPRRPVHPRSASFDTYRLAWQRLIWADCETLSGSTYVESPDSLGNYHGSGPGYSEAICLYAHARNAGAGPTRLVGVGFEPRAYFAGSDTSLIVQSYSLTGRLTSLKRLHESGGNLKFVCPLDQPLKLFVGQSDPADAAHFTIPYSTTKSAGTIDGRLNADDSVTLTIRDGPLKDAPAPTAAPTTRPLAGAKPPWLQ